MYQESKFADIVKINGHSKLIDLLFKDIAYFGLRESQYSSDPDGETLRELQEKLIQSQVLIASLIVYYRTPVSVYNSVYESFLNELARNNEEEII